MVRKMAPHHQRAEEIIAKREQVAAQSVQAKTESPPRVERFTRPGVELFKRPAARPGVERFDTAPARPGVNASTRAPRALAWSVSIPASPAATKRKPPADFGRIGANADPRLSGIPAQAAAPCPVFRPPASRPASRPSR